MAIEPIEPKDDWLADRYYHDLTDEEVEDMERESLNEYIEARELSYLWSHGGKDFYEDQMGNIVPLELIKKQWKTHLNTLQTR